MNFDITLYKKAESILKDSETRFSRLFEQSPVPIEIYDPDGYMLFVNKAWERLWNIKGEDSTGKFNVFFDDQIKEMGVLDHIKRAFSGETVEIEAATFDPAKSGQKGEKRTLHSTFYPIKNTAGEVEYIVILHEDITERKIAEEKLIEEKKRLESVINSIPDATIIVNERHEIQTCNPAFIELFGYTPEEIKGKTSSMFHAEEVTDNNREEGRFNYTSEMKNERYISYFKKSNGDVFHAETIGTSFTDDSGNTLGFIEILRDMTREFEQEAERKRLEKQLIQSQKMESIGRLAGGIAHDFNNILVGIMGYAELLTLKFKDDTTIEGEAADVIVQGAERAAELTKQLLGFARGGKYNPVTVNINDLIKETVKVTEKDL